jgi:uncharacterized protein YjgD (DUF1641 family)
MATELGYTPPTPEWSAAREDVDDLVRALHESGLLRALAGGARAYPGLLRQVIAVADAGTIRSVIELSRGLNDLDPDEAARVGQGIRRAREAAADAAAAEEPESIWGLLRRLRHPDTRRGLSALLAGLAALGAALQSGQNGPAGEHGVP